MGTFSITIANGLGYKFVVVVVMTKQRRALNAARPSKQQQQMGIDTDFVDKLIKLVPNGFFATVPDEARVDCLIVDGTSEIGAFLRAGGNIAESEKKTYRQWERGRTEAWRDLLVQNQMFHDLSSIVLLVDTDSLIPAAKNCTRSADRGYNAYTTTDMMRLKYVESRDARWLRQINLKPANSEDSHGGGDVVDTLELVDALQNEGFWGEPNRIWATTPLRQLLKEKYCQIMKRVLEQPDFHQLHCVKSIDNRMEVDEPFELKRRARDFHAPLFFIDAMSRHEIQPNFTMMSPEEFEQDMQIKSLHLRSSPGGERFQPDQRALLNGRSVGTDPVDVKGVWMGVLSSANHPASCFTPRTQCGIAGEADIKCTRYIHPDFGRTFAVRTDDTDMIPILLGVLEQYRGRKLPLPTIWLDRTGNPSLRSNLESNKRYIHLNALHTYLVDEGIPIERFMLITLMRGTDYVPILDSLGDPPPLKTNGKKAQTRSFCPIEKVAWPLLTTNAQFSQCVSVAWSEPASPVTFDANKLRECIFRLYVTAIGDRIDLVRATSFTQLQKLVAEYNGGHRDAPVAIPIPSGDAVTANICRMHWNLNYWINGAAEAARYTDAMTSVWSRRNPHTECLYHELCWKSVPIEESDPQFNALDSTLIGKYEKVVDPKTDEPHVRATPTYKLCLYKVVLGIKQ